MNNQNQENSKGWQSEGESLNTGSAPQGEQQAQKGGSGGAVLDAINAQGSATENARHNSGAARMDSTGTNVSYEGATAPGAGGAVGTGYASGKPATDNTISTTSDEDAAVGKHYDKPEGQNTATGAGEEAETEEGRS